jgi:hypothetical protein
MLNALSSRLAVAPVLNALCIIQQLTTGMLFEQLDDGHLSYCYNYSQLLLLRMIGPHVFGGCL